MKLEHRIAIVTGADSGIGQAIAELFAHEGADVCIGYHTDREGAEETKRRVEKAGRRAVVVQGDVGRPADVEALFQAASGLGIVDVLVNNAGKGMGGTPVAELEDEMLELVLRTDLMGPLFCCRAFIRLRKKHGGKGRIVTISSVAQHLPTPGSAPYGMAKAGVGSLTRSLAIELAPDRINVNNIAPGLIQTPMTQETLDDPEKSRKSMDSIPWHRPGQPEEIARLAVFLASDDADYVTGQTWTMDGGLTMNWGGA
ncbi:glucose 1-dehydrogenase [Lichenicola cladoniae]|uniref:Glucose 1-dehydrogenase n=1 Tax=Lichenicola cladoniae TaxID=1484109 RepID=A0A6M8HQN7_9PROT|nr:glucose 1-dehydrogenase [Lichenicola cladoniae]NPD68006.1 glucose 1-dehydrogenase [Acetobacteraceae bacterium]QKE90590.1 glucose 1-dehydrogenase [Lichenicola cladoniae]